MGFLKRYYQPIVLLIIVFAVILYLERSLSSTVSPQTEEVAVLLDQVDDVIAKMQHNSTGETAEMPVPPVSAQTVTTEDRKAEIQPSSAENSEPTDAAGEVESGLVSAAQSGTDESATASAASSAENEASLAGMSPEQIWQEARLAAWQGNPSKAIMYYRRLLAQQPDNFDAYGEMGNVMLSSGDREGAAEAYYQAAVLLNNTPHRMMAWHLLNVLAWLAPDKADTLYREFLPQP